MKIAIIFESKTGNTEMIARAMCDELRDNVVYFGAPHEEIEADVYVVGSWIDKGSVVTPISTLLSGLRDKSIACFCTAGFGQSEEYARRIMERVETIIDSSNRIIGVFVCQGKMRPETRERYIRLIHENPDDAQLRVAIENFDKASTHPDDEDITRAKAFIRDVVSRVE